MDYHTGTCKACQRPRCEDLDPEEGLCIGCYTSPSKVAARAARGVPTDVKGQVKIDGGGLRYNQGKVRWDLMPTDAMNEIAKVMSYGASKYAERNWERGQKWSVPYGSAMRHLLAYFGGEDYDPESGLLHMAHVGCNVLFLLAYFLRGMNQLDDRENLHKRDPRALQ